MAKITWLHSSGFNLAELRFYLPLNEAGYTRTSTLYVTKYTTNGADRDEYRGIGFTYKNGMLAGGTLTSITGYEDGQKMGVLEGFKLAITDVVAASKTTSTSDDMALYRKMLAGNDTITGGSSADRLDGFDGNDTITGNAGNDVLSGGLGADVMTGGAGNDTYYVDNASDRVVETSTGGTSDKVYTTVSHTLAQYVEHLYAQGSLSINLSGNTLANTIKGNAGANRIDGGSGDDALYGGAGNDTLYGRAGKDTFVFDTALSSSNVDKLVDFSVQDDTIRLENAVFKKLTKTGTLSTSFFTVGPKAKDTNDYIVYDSKTGVLSYDADGSGNGAAVKFAQLATNLKLTNADFVVI
ncbi:calcium-binding protein [Microvirga pakistanensis]|uniref:calcium-binding protein n=1 Tax=Microvirga pakistanensis TaxID=1682650 RepID=UPI001069A4A8|nr:calcium-binding protein [Microvirga pakistanensis]